MDLMDKAVADATPGKPVEYGRTIIDSIAKHVCHPFPGPGAIVDREGESASVWISTISEFTALVRALARQFAFRRRTREDLGAYHQA
jgi:hypothetical protein